MPPSDQPRRDRRAGDPDRREPVQLQPRRAVRSATDCPARTRHCWRRRSRPPASRSASRTRYNRTSGKCRRAMSAPTPRPMRRPRSRYLRSSTRSSIAKGTRAAYRLDVDLLPMVLEMRRRGIRIDQSAAEQARDYCLQKRDAALAELSEQLGSRVGMAEIDSREMEGANLRRPSASIIRARRRAIRRSRPANSGGWRRIRTGCRS